MAWRVDGLDDYIDGLKAAKKSFPDRLDKLLDEIAVKFLQAVQKEIRARNLIDTRNLLNSFSMDNENSIFEKSTQGKNHQVKVGSLVPYASYLNDGWTAINGNVIAPRPYFDTAQRAMEKLIEKRLLKDLGDWLNSI